MSPAHEGRRDPALNKPKGRAARERMRRSLQWIPVCALVLAIVAQPLPVAAVADVSQSPDLNLDGQQAPALDQATDTDSTSQTDAATTPSDQSADTNTVPQTDAATTPSDQSADTDTVPQTDAATTPSDQSADTDTASQTDAAATPFDQSADTNTPSPDGRRHDAFRSVR